MPGTKVRPYSGGSGGNGGGSDAAGSRANRKMVDRVNQLSTGGSNLKTVYKSLFEHLKREQKGTVSTKDVLNTPQLAARLAEKEVRACVRACVSACVRACVLA